MFEINCMLTYILWFTSTVRVFCTKAVASESDFQEEMDSSMGYTGREKVFLFWVTPLVVAISNFLFAGFAAMRVALNEAWLLAKGCRTERCGIIVMRSFDRLVCR